MTLYQIVCVVPALLLWFTVLARLNDIGRNKKERRWWLRRVGLLMMFVALSIFVASHFTAFAPYWRPTMALLWLWGTLFVFMTTPGMPPFWKYISRNDPEK